MAKNTEIDCSSAELPEGYEYVRSNGNVRTNLETDEEWSAWLEKFEVASKQKFIVKRTFKQAERYIYRHILVCQHNSKNKTLLSDNEKSMSTNCTASMEVKIKHVNRNTKKNDALLCRDPPLQAVIKMDLSHNHDIRSAKALGNLRVASSTQEQFYSYFDNGLTPAQAMMHHKNKLMCEDRGTEMLPNKAINPAPRSVYHLFSKWQTENFGSVSDEKGVVNAVSIDGRKETICSELLRISALLTSSEGTAKALDAIIPCLRSIRSDEDFIRVAYQCHFALPLIKDGSIKVRPTSITRRRPGAARGCKRIASGRPNTSNVSKRPLKKPRLLAVNTANNTTDVNEHGSGH